MVLIEEFEDEEDQSMDSETESENEIDVDSDSALQEAFSQGLIKPGTILRDPITEKPPRRQTNNVNGMKRKLEAFKFTAGWLERLDVVSGLAPLAPELAEKLQESVGPGQVVGFSEEADLAANDFQRELSFYRQAQATVLEALPRLQSLGIPTRRPEDYFAQMLKTDEHMQKVRESLAQKQTEEARREKIRNFRQQKKFGKKVEAEAKVAKQVQKKAMLDEVKKFRKGQRKDLDFLDDDKPGKPKIDQKEGNKDGKIKRSQFRRDSKDKKYGFGGKKRGKKSNTRESASDVFKGGRPSAGGRGGKSSSGGRKPGGFGGKGPQQRPGKGRRQQMKGRK